MICTGWIAGANVILGISVVLKEEATRIRQSEDIKKKRDNRKLWTQLPDRPIQQQRQHVLW